MRLDEFLFKNNYYDSRTKASQAIVRGEVYINGSVITKGSFKIDDSASLKIEKKCKTEYVSLGGYKLEKAFDDFNISVKDKICVDIGSSTGGFTDCLLQKGAKKVYSVDLNDHLLHESLKKDERVVSIIKNAKTLEKTDFLDKIDFICADLSFISATMIIPVLYNLIDDKSSLVLLIKPQFEMGQKIKLKNGIIRDDSIRKQACKRILDCAADNGFLINGLTRAPLHKDKNIEYLVFLTKERSVDYSFDEIYNNCL